MELLKRLVAPLTRLGAALVLAAVISCPVSAQTAPPPAAPAPAAASPQQSEQQLPAVAAPNNEPAAAQLPRDLSPWGMFLSADIVVKVVMIGLALASLVTWTIALAKGLEIVAAKRRLRSELTALARMPSLADAARKFGERQGLAPLVHAAMVELHLSADAGERAKVGRQLDPDQASVCTCTERTDGRSRIIAFQLSPESADA